MLPKGKRKRASTLVPFVPGVSRSHRAAKGEKKESKHIGAFCPWGEQEPLCCQKGKEREQAHWCLLSLGLAGATVLSSRRESKPIQTSLPTCVLSS